MRQILYISALCAAFYIGFLTGWSDRGDDGDIKYIFKKDITFSPKDCTDYTRNKIPYFVVNDSDRGIGIVGDSERGNIHTCADFFRLFESDLATPLTAPGKGD